MLTVLRQALSIHACIQSWLRSQTCARLLQLGGCQMTWYKSSSVAAQNSWAMKLFHQPQPMLKLLQKQLDLIVLGPCRCHQYYDLCERASVLKADVLAIAMEEMSRQIFDLFLWDQFLRTETGLALSCKLPHNILRGILQSCKQHDERKSKMHHVRMESFFNYRLMDIKQYVLKMHVFSWKVQVQWLHL